MCQAARAADVLAVVEHDGGFGYPSAVDARRRVAVSKKSFGIRVAAITINADDVCWQDTPRRRRQRRAFQSAGADVLGHRGGRAEETRRSYLR